VGQEATKVYDLRSVTCNLGGIPLDDMGGWGEGEAAIKIEKEAQQFITKKGADGSVVRSKTYDRVYKITLTLLQTAGANGVLSGLLTLDESAENGAGIVPILIRDRQGLNVFGGAEAWIMGWPKTVEFGASVKNVEWEIQVGDGEMFLGGN
jgi:hypothetical protein